MNSTATKRVIGPLSPSPSAYTENVVFTHPGGDAELRCTYERNGSMYAGGLRFRRVRSYRFRAEGHCTRWHIEDAYDTLVEVDQSEWIGELLADEPSETWGHWKIRHFLIYLDGAGAYEVAAEDVEWLPEEPASPPTNKNTSPPSSKVHSCATTPAKPSAAKPADYGW